MIEDTVSTRRERRIRRRRDLILNAAARLFAEKGFHRTTTRDIAQAADVSEGTLYNYFETKDELLMGIMSELVESQQIDTRLEDGLPSDARDFLQAMLRYRKESAEHIGPMFQAVFSEILVDPDLRQRYYRELVLPRLAVLEGHLRQRRDMGQINIVDTVSGARILFGLTTGLFVLEVLGDPPVKDNWEEMVNSITAILFDGVESKVVHNDPEEPVSP